MLNALVIGYGSIGKRHVEILENEFNCRVSVVSSHCHRANFYQDIVTALASNDISYVVIASKTHKHRECLEQLIKAGFEGDVLVEKPLFDACYPLMDHSFKQLFVAYNLRFHPALRSLKKALEGKTILSAQLYAGQYLPDWRPEQDYRNSYSASIKQGGGVLRDLSHELDIALWLFGDVKNLASLGGKISSLEIDSDDSQALLVEFERCSMATIQLNYIDKTARREYIVLTDKHSYKLDLVENSFEIDGEKTYFDVKRNDTYILQHKAIINGDIDLLCDDKQGVKVLDFINNIEKSAVNNVK